MEEFRFLDYHTEYTCKGDIRHSDDEAACFGYAFNRVQSESKVKYKITFYKGLDYCSDEHWSNGCVFTKREIRNHVRLLKQIFPIKYRVIENEDTFDVHLKIEGVPASFHKYALTWVRYLYEYPYNMLLRDAYLLKENPKFRFESIANLFNLTIGCYCESPRSIHQIPDNVIVKKLTIHELRERLKSVKKLNDIYKYVRDKDERIPYEYNGYDVEDWEFWEDGFEERKKVYLNNYKK